MRLSSLFDSRGFIVLTCLGAKVYLHGASVDGVVKLTNRTMICRQCKPSCIPVAGEREASGHARG